LAENRVQGAHTHHSPAPRREEDDAHREEDDAHRHFLPQLLHDPTAAFAERARLSPGVLHRTIS